MKASTSTSLLGTIQAPSGKVVGRDEGFSIASPQDLLGAIGSAILVYLTVIKALGHAIGQRPLLMLGVLLVVIGLQFFSLGLISEMITSHHEERVLAREQNDVRVEEVLS